MAALPDRDRLAAVDNDAALPRHARVAGHAYSSDTAPVDFEALRLALEALGRQDEAIDRGAVRLDELGISPRVVLGFTPLGITTYAFAR